ncbi:MAG: hypothetical protein V3R90_10930, partial [Limibaculum sp.]
SNWITRWGPATRTTRVGTEETAILARSKRQRGSLTPLSGALFIKSPTWKRQAIDGLGEVFSNGAGRARSDHEAEVKELHAKIGELTVVNDFLATCRRTVAADAAA